MSEVRFVSCDTSTKNSGLTLFVDGKYREHVLINKEEIDDVYQRINAMCIDIYKQLDKWRPDVLWIEHPQGHGKNVSMVGKLCEILGAVRMWCLLNNCECNEIDPPTWRMYAGIQQGNKKRNDLKQASIEYIKEKLGIDEGDDVADSIALGYAVINWFSMMEDKKDDY